MHHFLDACSVPCRCECRCFSVFFYTDHVHAERVIFSTSDRFLGGVQWGVFVLFACCVFLMTLSVYLFFPETKGVPIEDCPYVFKHHWYWKK